MKRSLVVLCASGAIIIIGLGVALLLALTAPRTVYPAASEPVSVPVDGQATVAVTREDLSEVLSLSASVVTAPAFVVDAVREGSVVPSPALGRGSHVTTATILYTQDGTAVRAPAAGTVVGWVTPAASTVPAGRPVLAIQYQGFGLTAGLQPQDAYRILSGRLTAAANIVNGPGPFDCSVLHPAPAGLVVVPGPIKQTPTASDRPSHNAARSRGPTTTRRRSTTPPTTASSVTVPAGEQASGQSTAILCAIPTDVRVFDGLSGQLALDSGLATNALALPASAVLGSAEFGEVYLVKGNKAVVQRVGLGATNGGTVQITSGLAAGDRILAVPPSLDGNS